MARIIPANHQSLICKILRVTGRRDRHCVKQRHQRTGRIFRGIFFTGIPFQKSLPGFCLHGALFYLQTDWLIFQINARCINQILRLGPIGGLFISCIFINCRNHPAVPFSILIIGNLIRINLQRHWF